MLPDHAARIAPGGAGFGAEQGVSAVKRSGSSSSVRIDSRTRFVSVTSAVGNQAEARSLEGIAQGFGVNAAGCNQCGEFLER